MLVRELRDSIAYEYRSWRRIEKFRVTLMHFLPWNFLRFGGLFNLFVPFLGLLIKNFIKNLR